MATAAELVILLTAKDAASAAIKGLGNSLGGLGGAGKAATAALAGMATIGAGVATGIGASVKAATDFEHAMSAVGAVAGASSSELAQLSQTALALGQDATLAGISASDAAVAMEQLASGGVSVADIMGGAARGALLLASAGGIDVAQAAEIAAAALNNFGLAGNQAGHVADLFAAASNSSAVTVGDLGESMKYIGPIANSMGLSIDEVTAALAELGDQGIKGSQAGTSLRSILASLAKPSKQAASLIEDLGLQFFDAGGKMKSLGGISGELHDKLAGLTDQQRANALVTLFGNEALSAATTLYGEGAAGIAKYLDQVNVEGSAAANGAKRNDNLRGSFEQLKSSIETAEITLGTALIPTLRALTDQAARAVTAAIPLIALYGPKLIAAIQQGLGQAGGIVRDFAAAIVALFHALTTGDFSALFGPLITAISTAFGSQAAGAVTLFVSSLVHGLNLARDAVLTVRQAIAGDWFGGQDQSINLFVRAIGRFTQLVRDSFVTIRQAWDHNWISAPEIQPVVRMIGEMTVAVRGVADALVTAGQRFSAAFTTGRMAILKQLASDLLAVYTASQRLRFDALLTALGAIATALPPVADGLGKFVGWLIDGIGWLQSTGHEVDVLNVALAALGVWIGLNKVADLVAQFGAAGKAAGVAASAIKDFFATATRGPRLVITTIRTIYETVGQAATAGANVVQNVTAVIKTAFASAQDAVIWAQLYGEQALKTVTQSIKAVYEALPTPPSLPTLLQKVQFDIPPFPTITPPTLSLKVTIPAPDVGTIGSDIGTKIAGGIASGIGIAIGGAIAASGVGAAIGGAIVAALPVILIAAGVAAQGVAVYFMAQLVAGLIQQAGGLGPYLSGIFLQAVPYAIGAIAGEAANLGLQFVLLVIQGITQGIPALLGFVGENFQAIVQAILLVLFPLPTLIFGVLQQIGPLIATTFGQIVATVTDAGGKILGAIGGAFSQVGTVVSTALASIAGIVGNAFSAIGTAVQNALAPIATIIQAIIQGDWGAAIRAGIELLVNLFVDLPAQIVGIVADAMGQVVAVIGDAWASVTGIVGDALGQVVGIVADTWATVTGIIADAGASILEAMQSAWQGITTAVSGAIDGITSAVTTWLANLVSGFQSTFNGDLLTAVTTGISGIRDSIANGLNEAKAIAQTALEGIATAATTAMGNLKNAISEGISTAKATISNGVSGFADAVLAVGPSLYSAGASIIGMLSSGIESAIGAAVQKVRDGLSQIANLLPHSEPKDPASPLRGLTDSGRAIFEMFADGIKQGAPAAVKAAAEAASAVAKAITDSLGALKALSSFDTAKNVPTAGQLGAVIAFMANTTAMLAEVGAQFSEKALKAANDFADSAGKVATAIGNGVKALTDLIKFVPPADAAIYAFGKSLRAIVNDFAVLSEQVTQEMADEAAAFAESVGKVVAIIGQGVQGFTALTTFVAPPVAAIYAFGKTLRAVVNDFALLSEQITVDMYTEAASFAEGAGKVVAIIGNGVAGFLALNDYAPPAADAIYSFGKTLRSVINDFALLAEQITQDATEQAAKFAAGAGKVIAIIGGGVEGFTKLLTFTAPSAAAIDNFAYAVREMVAKFADLASTISADGIKNADALGGAAGTIFAALKNALDVFTGLAKLVVPSAKAIDDFGIAVAYTVAKIGSLADQIGRDGIKRAADFGASIATIFGSLKTSMDILTNLAKFKDVAAKAFDSLLAGMQGAVERAQGMVDQAKIIKLQSEEYAALMAQATVNFAKGLGATGSPQEIGRKLGEGVVHGAREALDSHSPSEVMASIGRDVVAGLVAGMDEKAIDAAKAASDLASSVAKAITDTLGAMKALAAFDFAKSTPTGGQIDGALGFIRQAIDGVRAVAGDLADLTTDAGKALSDAAGRWMDTAGKAVGLFSSGVDALAKLGTFVAPTSAAIFAFGATLRTAINDLAVLAERVTQEMVDLAAPFAESAAKAVAVFGAGLDGFTKLATFARPPAAAIYAFDAALRDALNDLALLAEQLTTDTSDLAGKFADGAAKAVGLIGNGLAGFTGLLTFVRPAATAIYAFDATVRDFINDLALVAEQVTTESADLAGKFADGASKAVALIANGVAGFKALSDYTSPAYAAMQAFVADTRALVGLVSAAGWDLSQGGLDAATRLADAASKVLGTLSGVKGLADLKDYASPPLTAMRAFAADVRALVGYVSAAGWDMAQDGLDAASRLADAGGKVLSLVGGAVGGLSGLSTFVTPGRAAVDGLIATIRYVVARFGEMAATMATEGIEQTGKFGDATSAVLGGVKAAIDTFIALDKAGVPQTGDLSDLVVAVQGVTRNMATAAAALGDDAIKDATAFGTAAQGIFTALKGGLDLFVQIDKPGGWPTTDWLQPLIELMAGVLLRGGQLLTQSQELKAIADQFSANITQAAATFATGIGGGGLALTGNVGGISGNGGGAGGGAVVNYNYYVSGNTLLSKDTSTQQMVSGIVTTQRNRTVGYSVSG